MPAPAPVRLQVIAVPVPVSSAAVPMSGQPFAFHGHGQGHSQGFAQGHGQGQGQGRPVSAPTVAQVDALMQELQNARGMGSASVPVGSAFLPGALGSFSAVAPGYHAQAQAQAHGRLPPILNMNMSMNMNHAQTMPLPSGLPPLSTQTFPVSFPFSHHPSTFPAATAFSTTPTSTHTPRPSRSNMHANSRANIRAKAKWVRDRHGILRPDLHLDTDVRAELRLMAHSATSSPMSEESGAGGGRRFWVEESGSGSGSGVSSGSGSGLGQGKGQGKSQSLLQQVEEGMQNPSGERGSTMSAQSRVASPDMFDEDTFDATQDRVLDAPERPHSSASMTVPDHRYAPVPDDATPGTSGFQHPWPTLEEICALKAARNTT